MITTPLQPLLCALPPTIDRFADSNDRICKRFSSELASPGSLAIDSLSQDWRNGVNFWNPPLELLPLVATKIFHEPTCGILVTPHWPAQSWYTRLLRETVLDVYRAEHLYLPSLWATSPMPAPPWKIAVWIIWPKTQRSSC